MKTFMKKLYHSSTHIRRLHHSFSPLFRKRSRRQKYWEFINFLPERDLTVDTLHGRLSLSSKDRVIGRKLFVTRQYGYVDLLKAIDILKLHNKLLESNHGYIVDIGANIGTVCIPLVSNGVFRKALAFEPEPRNFRYLLRNIEQNQLTNRISAYQFGLTSTKGELELEICDNNYGDHRIRMEGSSLLNYYGEQARKVIRVPMQSLDYTIQSLGLDPKELKLLWIDVQGHEWYVLQGAKSTLATDVPVVIELWPYGLQSLGTNIELFIEIVSTNFTYLFDLREQNPQKRPVSYIREMFAILSSSGSDSQTDVLLLN